MKKRGVHRVTWVVMGLIFIVHNITAYSPTENYLKFITPSFIEEQLWGTPRSRGYETESVDKYAPIINKVIAKEKELQNTHYPFYNATMLDYLLIKDFFKSLQCKLKNVCWINFEQLRPEKDLFKSMNSIDDFFEFWKSGGYTNDHDDDLRKVLASVNLSFPGAYFHAESTFFYFSRPATQLGNPEKSYRLFIKSMLKQFPQIEKLPEDLIDKFVEKIAGLRSYFSNIQSGLLYQIFIPKGVVDKYVYLAESYGHPYGHEKIEFGFGGELIDMFPGIWNADKQRFTKISPILDLFQASPDKMPRDELEALQARIVLTKDLFASPNSGVEIFKYHMIDDNTLSKLNEEIGRVSNEIVESTKK